MSLFHAEREFRNRGEEFAANSLKLLREQFGDIPPPNQTEIEKAPLSKETQQLVERLKKDGFAVYDLSGKTPATLRKEGMKLGYVSPALEQVSAKPSLIAFKQNPDEFFLKESFGIPHENQLELLEKYNQEIQRQYPGAGLNAREAEASEWVEAAFLHFKATDKSLFGKDYNFCLTWTNTYEDKEPGAYRADFGCGSDDSGLGMSLNLPPGYVDPDLGLAFVVEIPRI